MPKERSGSSYLPRRPTTPVVSVPPRLQYTITCWSGFSDACASSANRLLRSAGSKVIRYRRCTEADVRADVLACGCAPVGIPHPLSAQRNDPSC